MAIRLFGKLFLSVILLPFAALLNAQEQGLMRLTNDVNTDQFPIWSPDGKSIVFASFSFPGDVNPDLWEVSPSGTNLQQLTTGTHGYYGGGIQDPAWLGSSDLVVLDTVYYWEWDRFTLSANPLLPVNHSVANGSQPDFDELLFVPGGLGGQWLAVSPNGTTVAWDALTTLTGQCPSHTDLHVAPLSTLTGQDNNTYGQIIASFNLNCSVANTDSIVGLSFSPDGSQIVAGTLSDPNHYAFDLSIYKLDGTLVRQLTTSGAGPNHTTNWRPVWSSDNRIAFASNSTGRFEVWTINADGSNLTQVTTNGGDMPTWSPDASKIAFASSRNGTPQIYSMSVGGATVIPQPTPPPTGSGAATSPTNHEGTVAEPVSTGSGNYHYEHADFTIPAGGLPLTFTRSYNAIDSFSGPLGTNWNHTYNVLLGQTAAGVATIRWGDGHGETYTLTGGAYIPQAGVYNTLVANTDGTFTLTQKNQMRYIFSSAGKLAAILDKNGNTTTLAYDGSGNLVTIAAAGGRTLTLAYDTSGRILSVTDPMGHAESFSYDAANDLVSATDPLGGITTYGYDAGHHVTHITLPNGNTLLQNTYDSQGRTISQTNGRGYTWQFEYNTPAAGQTTITDARGPITVHTYDGSLRIVSILDALGHTTSYTYDANSDRTSVTNQNGNATSFAYDATGNVLTVTDPLSDKTTFTYDGSNNLLTATNPKGRTTTFSYDAHSNLIGIQDALGDKTALTYDSFGELNGRTDALGNTTSFTYGGAGDLTGIKDAIGNATALAYDADGRLTSVTDPNLHSATFAYDSLGRLTNVSDAPGDKTTFAYDGVGNLLSVKDANGHTTGYAYDAVNNFLTVTDALGHVTKYSYDADNNRIGFTNAKGNATTYQYDSVNRLISTVDPLSFATTYGYDSADNVLTVTDAKGQTNHFAYDALNRLLSIAYADGKNVAYSYDADGSRTSLVDWTGTTSYQYDALDRLASVIFPGSKTVAYSYDANGRRVSLTYPDSKVVRYGYDSDERLSTVTDWLSHVTQYAYDPAGNLVSTQYPNKAGINFAYDAANRLTSVVNNTVGLPPLPFKYTLDAVGNRTMVTEAGITTNYGYDALNELTSAQLSLLKTTWTYDPVGNRLSQASPLGMTNYSYDASDRLLKAGTRTFTYDADGNETSVTDSITRGKHTYTWNAANRLVSVDGGLTDSFVYDGDGNRVSQLAGGSTQSYVNDVAVALPVVLQDTYTSGSPSSYVYGLNLIEAAQGRDNDFYQYDGLGSVIQLTNTAGFPELSYFYDAWGNSILPAPSTNSIRFAGQALDPTINLYYLRARYYDPSVGRFVSRDPIQGNVRSPQSLNRYEYVLSNPLRFIDPSGLTTQDAVQNPQWSPLALGFSLPNMSNNPQFTPQGKPVICEGLNDCVADALTIVSSAAGSGTAGDVTSFISSAFSSYNDATQPNESSAAKILSIGGEAALLVIGLSDPVLGGTISLELYLVNETPKVPDTIPVTTPSVAMPIAPFQLRQ